MISPQDVKKLRDKTGAGFSDCKKALDAAGGDFATAEKKLKEMGLASAAKRSGRAATEGRIFSFKSDNKAGVIELACETDFVARNSDFVNFGESLVKELVTAGTMELNEAQDLKLKEIAALIKENISLKNAVITDIAPNEVVADYIHGEGRIGVLVKLTLEDSSKTTEDKIKNFAFDCALHVAAFNPQYLNRDAIDPAYIKEQEEIIKVQTANMDKPEKVLQGIISGKLNKHLSGICFVDQPFVKDDKMSVQKAAETLSKEVGTKVTISAFNCLLIGQEN